jgi:GTP-binding protein EngB required for normal cell division
MTVATEDWTLPSYDPDETEHLEVMREIQKAKVLIVGRCGVGKSALVNRLFNARLRESYPGHPCYEEWAEVGTEGFNVRLVDGPGLESEAFPKQFKDLKEQIALANRSINPEKHYACALFVASANQKWEDADKSIVKELKDAKIPIAFVLSNAYEKEKLEGITTQLKASVATIGMSASEVFIYPVNTIPFIGKIPPPPPSSSGRRRPTPIREQSGSKTPVSGIWDLADGLCELVKTGLECSRLKIEGNERNLVERAETIIESAADKCGSWTRIVFFLPIIGVTKLLSRQKEMLTELCVLFMRESPPSSFVDLLIDKIRDGDATKALILLDLVKMVPIVGWIIGSEGGGRATDETRVLGYDVRDFFLGLLRKIPSIDYRSAHDWLSRV